jgi:hypothetical protein
LYPDSSDDCDPYRCAAVRRREAAMTSPLRELTVSGTAHQRGRELGLAQGPELRAFLSEGLARLEWIAGRQLERGSLDAAIARHAEVIERHLPDVAASVHGLAEGADLPISSAWLLQLRRELLREVAAADCTTLAAGGERPWLAQTVDLPGDLAAHAIVVREHDGTHTALQLTFTGLLGYLGLNDRGLAVGINMVMSNDWKPGVPPYLLMRHLLGLGSVEECLDALAWVPRASSRCYTLIDRHQAVMVETTCERIAVLRQGPLVHTNHYLAGELATDERSHVMRRRESRQRHDRATAALAAATTGLATGGRPPTGEQLFDLLACHGQGGSCFHGDGDPRRFSTAAAVVLHPVEGRLAARRGPPCQSVTTHHTIEAAHA